MSRSLFDKEFDEINAAFLPLAARMRPKHLDDYVGQKHILTEGQPLRESIEQGQLHSLIFWGPPGVGKTTLAKLIAHYTDAHFHEISAVLAGVKDIRIAIDEAKQRRISNQQQTILFVDEVHRFNKSQQDAFLPHIENGEIVFIGATTENPSFELNSALLSRARVYTLKALDKDDLIGLVNKALMKDELISKKGLNINEDAKGRLVQAADGDARRLLNLLEHCVDLINDDSGAKSGLIDITMIDDVLRTGLRRFDNKGEVFYDQISAMHKSIRGSDPDAALYWFCRMLDGGCDPLYLARRIVRTASEDIGNADPRALELALNAWQVQERLGSPEGELALAQAVCYLSSAPKSNAVYKAFNKTMQTIKATGSLDVPLHIRNAPTKLMQELDYGVGYRYAHDEPEAFAAGEAYLPEELIGTQLYQPVERGLEVKIKQKLTYLSKLNANSPNKRHEK